MEILIADSGSTKTDWVCLNDTGSLRRCQTQGMNPYFTSAAEMEAVLQQEVLNTLGIQGAFQAWFYGAGCGAADKAAQVEAVLRKAGAVDAVACTDLLGAARALSGQEGGLAAILGTGANAGVYNGQEITQTAPSTGYILGDEGSGTWLGKQLLTAWIRGTMPDHVRHVFEQRFQPAHDALLDRIYRGERPNHYIAGFARILEELPGHPWCEALIRRGFADFVRAYITPLNPGVHTRMVAAGSVAMAFPELLKEAVSLAGLQLVALGSDLVDGLVAYHRR